MFLDFWKLREQPFGVTPDPRYLYFSPGHREALATLFYGIETGRGFLSLVAQPGMGKTTLLFQLLKRWKGYVHSAFLFQTQCDSRELIRYLLEDLGLKSDDGDIVRMHSELNDFLFRETKAGRRVVVFIDEAQNLSDAVLETVRLLSNFEAPDKKLLQIVLAGQPELAQRLASPKLAQLRQRIAVQARLDPLPPAEVIRYVNHRLLVAGYHGPELFTPEALEVIAGLSHGIPRLINVLCFNALSLGFAMRHKEIDSEIVQEAAKDQVLDSAFPNPRVPQTQAAQPHGHNARPARQSIRSWIQDRAMLRHLVQLSVLTILLGSAMMYVGARARQVKANLSSVSEANHANISASPSYRSPDGLRPQASPRTETRDGSSDALSFVYVVQPHDTIRDLCLSTFGRYDDEVLANFRKLNPALKNANHLEVGQEIRLPFSSKNQRPSTAPAR
jgi:general secretion pathway protein A